MIFGRSVVACAALVLATVVLCRADQIDAEGIFGDELIHIHVVAYYEWEVNYILDTVVDCLLANPMRKFIEVEIAYFERWWNDQDDDRKQDVRQLVSEGRFQFVQGGWCMHDEAVTNYVSQINQLTEGHTFILNEFGESAIPRIAWHIDPFGASNMSPGLFAEAGYEAFVINRLDFRIKDDMKKNQGLEFVWQGSKSLGSSVEMFSHVLDSHYNTPKGFDWEHGVSQSLPQGDGPPPVITNPPSFITKANVHRRAKEFVAMARHRQSWYRTPNILIPFGSDFNFQNALMKYKNMDKLINYINDNPEEFNATAQYSTLKDYFDAVHSEDLVWDVHTVDFFPYADNNASYWSGFYTSRPDLKQLSRETDAQLRTAELLLSLGNGCDQAVPQEQKEETEQKSINIIAEHQSCSQGMSYNKTEMFVQQQYLRRAAAVSQHHDAVTGTERKHVYKDYQKRLDHGSGTSGAVAEGVVSQLFGLGSNNQRFDFTQDVEQLSTWMASGEPLVLAVFNPLEWTRTDVVMLPVPNSNYNVIDSLGNPLAFDFAPSPDSESAPFNLFIVVTVSPLGYTTVVLEPISATKPSNTARRTIATDATLKNGQVEVVFANGALASMASGALNMSLSQSMMYYTPFNGSQTSGAYIFRPDPDTPPQRIAQVTPTIEVFQGNVVGQTVQLFNESGVQVVTRVFNGVDDDLAMAVHQNIRVGPIDVDEASLVGKEVITRYITSVENNDMFFTDNNGMETQTRFRNLNGRPGDNDTGVALAGNYYPIVSRAFIKDRNGVSGDPRQFTVMTAHSHGGSSLDEGDLELMIHRRLLRDDARGVGQALNDTSIVTARLSLLLAPPESSAKYHRKLANTLQYPLVPFFAAVPGGVTSLKQYLPEFEPLVADLPANVRIISLKPLTAGSDIVILRLMNIFQAGEDAQLSQPVTVDIQDIFDVLVVSDVEERTLTGLMRATENIRPTWRTSAPSEHRSAGKIREEKRAFDVTLNPMEIRTFWVTLREP